MNRSKSPRSPAHATPTNVALPDHSLAAASTEVASALHVAQNGDQNQNTAVSPASVDASSSPPPTSGAVNARTSGTAAVALVSAEGDAVGSGARLLSISAAAAGDEYGRRGEHGEEEAARPHRPQTVSGRSRLMSMCTPGPIVEDTVILRR